MGVAYFRGQQLGRRDLHLYLHNTNDVPVNAAIMSYAFFDYTTGEGVLVGPPQRRPENPAIGEYYASNLIPLDANLGPYRVKWTFQEIIGGQVQQVVQEFEVVDKSTGLQDRPEERYSSVMHQLGDSLRVLLRDNNPDRNYHFRPPTHERTIQQYSKVFGFIWESTELYEFIRLALNDIIAYPPRTPFASVEAMMQGRQEWETVLLTGAMAKALHALRNNWIADEFDYSIGGVSLALDKASKYEGAYNGTVEMWDKQIEKAKATVNYIAGLQQPKYGTGIRSAFGPYAGRGVLSPRKFMGF